MPQKFKPSVVTFDKTLNKKVSKHYYMSGTSTKEILEMYEKPSTQPKIKDKLKKVLVKRGVA